MGWPVSSPYFCNLRSLTCPKHLQPFPHAATPIVGGHPEIYTPDRRSTLRKCSCGAGKARPVQPLVAVPDSIWYNCIAFVLQLEFQLGGPISARTASKISLVVLVGGIDLARPFALQTTNSCTGKPYMPLLFLLLWGSMRLSLEQVAWGEVPAEIAILARHTHLQNRNISRYKSKWLSSLEQLRAK